MKRLLTIGILIGLTGCGLKKEQDVNVNVSPEEAVVESAMGAIGGLGDEQAGESYAARSSMQDKMYAAVQDLLLPQAQAAWCSRAIFEVCSAGVRQANYNSCQPVGTRVSLNGYVRLSYSQSDCSMALAGDSVTRSYDLQFNGPRGGTASINSATLADYRGTSYGGGGQLTKTAGGWSINVLGKHINLSYRGRALYDISIRTLSALDISGTLTRQNRLVTSGQLEVNHNLAKFSALLQPQNLQWTSGCCYPISGSLAVQYSGSRTGSATVTFNGCGTAVHDDGVQQRSIELNYCE